MSRLKVYELTDSEAWWGTERHILELCVGLRDEADEAIEPTVVCPPGGNLWTGAQQERIACLPLPKRGMLDPAAIRALAGALRRGDADILHAHNGRMLLHAVLARRLARRGACVLTQHFIQPAHVRHRGGKGSLLRRIHCRTEASVARIIAVSRSVLNAAASRNPASIPRLRLVYNGVRLPVVDRKEARRTLRNAGAGESFPHVVTVSRLTPEKEVHLLIEAAVELRRVFPNVKVWIVGGGPLEEDLRERADKLDLQAIVHFTGYRQDAHQIMAAADVFALPASGEPFGLALVEAMGLGAPVVAADEGGAREIVEQGISGVLVRPSDPAALAEGILSLLMDRDYAARLARAGRERARSLFSAEAMARQTAVVYREAVGA